MTVLKNVSLDYKFAGFFGLCAVFISVFIGVISRVNAGDIFIRMLIILPVFSGLGFGIMYVVKRFVPEAYALLSKEKSEDDELLNAGSGLKEEEYSSKVAQKEDESGLGNNDEEGFRELSGKDFQAISDNDIGVSDNTFSNTDGRKLGKHLVANQKFGNYEPKIMAEAVRTMMSKDED